MPFDLQCHTIKQGHGAFPPLYSLFTLPSLGLPRQLLISPSMESSIGLVRDLSPHERNRLEAAAQVVIESARSSDNSTGINWRRLATTTIDENYLTRYPELTNQEIALNETLEEVERRIVDGHLDLVRIDNLELQGTIEDVLNDILDFMVHDAQASDDSDTTDSSGTDDSDSDGPPNSDRDDDPSDTSGSDSDDSSDAHQGHHYGRPHEADRNYNGTSSSNRPHYLVDSHPSPSTRTEGPQNLSESRSDTSILRGLLQSEETLTATTASSSGNAEGSGGKQEGGAICCSTM